MNIIPNTETVRHLCHFYGASQYYLLAGTETQKPALATDVKNTEQLSNELKSWCGMDIDVYYLDSNKPETENVINNGIALHRAGENMSVGEI